LEVFKWYYNKKLGKKPTAGNINEFLRFRPNEEVINEFIVYCEEFWNNMINNFEDLEVYIQKSEDNEPAQNYRDKETGGNLLFRPVGLLPFVKSVVELNFREGTSLEKVIRVLSRYNFSLNEKPWIKVNWDPISKSMIMGSNELTKLIFIYAYNETLLKTNELKKLKEKYANKIGYEDEDWELAIEEIPKIN
jgi:DNA sulfur modification protein DndB